MPADQVPPPTSPVIGVHSAPNLPGQAPPQSVAFNVLLLPPSMRERWPMADDGNQDEHDLDLASALLAAGLSRDAAVWAIRTRRDLLSPEKAGPPKEVAYFWSVIADAESRLQTESGLWRALPLSSEPDILRTEDIARIFDLSSSSALKAMHRGEFGTVHKRGKGYFVWKQDLLATLGAGNKATQGQANA
jgi:hypothetical protein